MEITPEQYRAALKVVREYRDQLRAKLDKVVIEVREADGKDDIQKHSTLYDLVSKKQCSFRLYGVIYHNTNTLGIQGIPGYKIKVSDLKGVSASKLLECRNVGKATVQEFKELCDICGVRWLP